VAIRIAPDSAIAAAASRTTMAAALPALMRRRDPVTAALAEALRTTALGRIPGEERAWAARIEAQRRTIPTSIATQDAGERDVVEHLAEATTACRWMSLPPVWGCLLMRLVRVLAPRSCIELGTGFGISAAYQAAALELNGAGRLVSLDVPALAGLARRELAKLGLASRVEVVPGLIDDTLAAALERAAPIDYALLDADHTEEATIAHFEAILPSLADRAVVAFDDINWTDGMRRAWTAIRGHERVAASTGVRRVGIVVVAAG
jgi:predicted O-methyltransferase YrrM